jgi:putative membrane protein
MTTLAARFQIVRPSRTDYPVFAFIAVWVLSMIALPIALWLLGDSAIGWGVTVTVFLQVVAVSVTLGQRWGWKRTIFALVVVAIVTWMAEVTGSRTGFPFGYYHYTNRLQPQLAGVPFFVPLAWFMMLPPAWAVAQAIGGARSRFGFVVLSAAALTVWDFFLDPQKVAWRFWVWTDSSGANVYSGGYFGIPWVNFVGWFAVAALVTAIVRPDNLPLRPLLLIYGITWIFQTIGQLLFWNLPGPGLVGFAAMGSMLAFACLSRRDTNQS